MSFRIKQQKQYWIGSALAYQVHDTHLNGAKSP